jgi:copper type II ascorbate-dependent monooxygenase-like protein
MRSFVLAAFLIACGSSKTGTGTQTDAPALSGTPHMLQWGPVTVQPGVESTQCIWVHLDNAAEIKVHQLHDTLSTASHHLIVYKDDMDTTEQTTPTPCQPFTGALNTTGMIEPIAITQKKDDEITLPDGVAYTFAPHQMVKLEMHYINSSDAAEDATAQVVFYEADPATIQNEAAILFAGSPDIDILAGQMLTLHQFFSVPSYLDLSQSKIFAITGHEHHYGTGVQVNVAPSKSGPMTSVYAPNPFVWSEPETEAHDPGFSVPVGGGFDFTCTWTNTGTTEVKFGESANNEMCFFWAYYYPSQGSKVCFHTEKYGGANGLNFCCPGDSLCSYANMF